jgi:hypothetical protein
MTVVRLRQLPMVTRVATMTTFFMGWVLIAELIIDRHGSDAIPPLYQVGNLCLYDLIVAGALLALWWALHR